MPKVKDSVTITGAQVSLKEDQAARTRRYLISMALRTACFIGAVVTTGWVRWTLVVGAVILPYIAVVAANAGRKKAPKVTPTMILNDQRQIGSGRVE